MPESRRDQQENKKTHLIASELSSTNLELAEDDTYEAISLDKPYKFYDDDEIVDAIDKWLSAFEKEPIFKGDRLGESDNGGFYRGYVGGGAALMARVRASYERKDIWPNGEVEIEDSRPMTGMRLEHIPRDWDKLSSDERGKTGRDYQGYFPRYILKSETDDDIDIYPYIRACLRMVILANGLASLTMSRKGTRDYSEYFSNDNRTQDIDQSMRDALMQNIPDTMRVLKLSNGAEFIDPNDLRDWLDKTGLVEYRKDDFEPKPYGIKHRRKIEPLASFIVLKEAEKS